MIHEAKSICILWAMGVTQHMGATDTSTAISNLLLITGNYGRPGTGAYPLRGHNNVQGACDFGTMPAWFPGYEPIQDDKVRARYEQAWGVSLPKEPGYDKHQMVEGIHMGANWNYTHPSEIMAEDARLAPVFAGVSYERLEGWNSLMWPVAPDGKDTPLLYTDTFAFPDGKAKLFPVNRTPPFKPGKEYDLHLNNGRIPEHFHEGNMTYRSEGIRHKVPSVWLEISPELAQERNIKDGALVRLTSPYGQVEVPVLITDRVKGNELYLPMNTRKDNEAVNRLTSSYHDIVTHTPNFKEMDVQLEILEPEGEIPLPRQNHRFGNRVPQVGVKVEEKWSRPGYVPVADTVTKKEGAYGKGNFRD
jgi:formate dehydrogenase major subunit